MTDKSYITIDILRTAIKAAEAELAKLKKMEHEWSLEIRQQEIDEARKEPLADVEKWLVREMYNHWAADMLPEGKKDEEVAEKLRKMNYVYVSYSHGNCLYYQLTKEGRALAEQLIEEWIKGE